MRRIVLTLFVWCALSVAGSGVVYAQYIDRCTEKWQQCDTNANDIYKKCSDGHFDTAVKKMRVCFDGITRLDLIDRKSYDKAFACYFVVKDAYTQALKQCINTHNQHTDACVSEYTQCLGFPEPTPPNKQKSGAAWSED